MFLCINVKSTATGETSFFLFSGSLNSPNFPSNYSNNHDSNQSMEVGDGQRLLIKFNTFSLEGGSSCYYDSVMIQDNDGTILMEKTCSTNLPSVILSKTNKAVVIFKTDGSVVESGWSLQYGPVPGCIVLDPDSGSWVPGLRPLRHIRIHSTVISSALGVYIIGGTSSPYTSEFYPAMATTTSTTTTTTTTTTAKQFWEEGPDLPIAMDYGCALSISSSAFMIISKRDVRVFEAAFESGKPTSNNNWMDSTTWPVLQTERWYHPGCAVIGKTVVIAGGFKSPVSMFSTGSTPVSSGSSESSGSSGSGSSGPPMFRWCSVRCNVRRHNQCCCNPVCRLRRPRVCRWINYLRQGKILKIHLCYGLI